MSVSIRISCILDFDQLAALVLLKVITVMNGIVVNFLIRNHFDARKL